MKNYRFLALLGLILLVTPFLGIPSIFRNIIIFAVAIFLLFYALLLRSASKQLENDSHESSFSESNMTDSRMEDEPVADVERILKKVDEDFDLEDSD
jgi:hypothetical protein